MCVDYARSETHKKICFKLVDQYISFNCMLSATDLFISKYFLEDYRETNKSKQPN